MYTIEYDFHLKNKKCRTTLTPKKYEKPTIVRLAKMRFPVDIIEKSAGVSGVVCRQCSSCHSCR